MLFLIYHTNRLHDFSKLLSDAHFFSVLLFWWWYMYGSCDYFAIVTAACLQVFKINYVTWLLTSCLNELENSPRQEIILFWIWLYVLIANISLKNVLVLPCMICKAILKIISLWNCLYIYCFKFIPKNQVSCATFWIELNWIQQVTMFFFLCVDQYADKKEREILT